MTSPSSLTTTPVATRRAPDGASPAAYSRATAEARARSIASESRSSRRSRTSSTRPAVASAVPGVGPGDSSGGGPRVERQHDAEDGAIKTGRDMGPTHREVMPGRRQR